MLDENKSVEDEVASKAAEAAAKEAEDNKAKEAAEGVKVDDTPGAGDDEGTQETGDTAAEFDKDVWGTTGDETGDSVYQLLHESGVSVTDAKALLYDAVKAGKPEDIDKEALVEAVGKVKANLIMAGIENFVGKQQAVQAKAVAAVHEAAGGKEAWETMLPWISKSVPEEELVEYREMIDAGGVKAKLAVKELTARYNADPKNPRIAKQEVVGGTDPVKDAPGITQREYGDKLVALNRTGKATADALAKLKADRQRGKKQGI